MLSKCINKRKIRERASTERNQGHAAIPVLAV